MRQHEPNTNFTPKLSHGNAHLVPQNESLGPTSAAHECTHRVLGSHRSFGFSTEGCRRHSWLLDAFGLAVLRMLWHSRETRGVPKLRPLKIWFGSQRTPNQQTRLYKGPMDSTCRFLTGSHSPSMESASRRRHVKQLQTKKARRTIILLPINHITPVQIRSTHLHLSLPFIITPRPNPRK